MAMRKKVYAYEIFDGDKGVIIARTYNKACKILKKQYGIDITKDDEGYFSKGMAFLYEVGGVKNNHLYATFEF